MRTTRIFCDLPLQHAQQITLPAPAADHVARVLRLRVGAPLTLFNGQGGEYAAQLATVAKRTVTAQVLQFYPIERESARPLMLLQSLTRGEKMDWIIQKATELGVTVIQPITTERCVVNLDGARGDKRLAHWRAVAASACEQCGRNRLPEVREPCALADALADEPATVAQDAGAARIVLVPGASRSLDAIARQATAVSVVVGPEGGLTPAELDLLAARSFDPASLGSRILRMETAAIAALAILSVSAEDQPR